MRFAQMVDIALAADLDALRAEARAVADASGAPLYHVSDDGIALIELAGALTKYQTSFQSLFGGTSTVATRKAVRAAARDESVLGIMLVVDSPGGTIAGTSELADDIADAAGTKPVHTYVSDLMGSAALWIGSSARKVWSNKGAQIGSVGAFAVVTDTSGVYAQKGAKVWVIKSGEFKGVGTPGTEITEEQRAEIQRRIDDLAAVFVSELAAHRGMSLERAKALATGQMWVSSKAKELGLIDDVVSFDEAMRRLKEEAMSENQVKELEAKAEASEAQAKEVSARAEAAEAEVKELKARVAAMEAKERDARFEAMVKELGLTKDMAKVLDAVDAKAGAEVLNALVTQFKALSAQIDTSALFSEKGSPGADATAASASDQLLSLAQARVKEGKAKNMPDAVSAIAAERPDLYKLYVEEQRKGA